MGEIKRRKGSKIILQKVEVKNCKYFPLLKFSRTRKKKTDKIFVEFSCSFLKHQRIYLEANTLFIIRTR